MIERMPNGSGTVAEERDERMGLIGYLAKLGLADADLAKAISLLPMPDVSNVPKVLDAPYKVEEGEEFSQEFTEGSLQDASPQPGLRRFERKKTVSGKRTIRLFMAEEQQILREAYLSFFSGQPGIELSGVTDDTSAESLIDSVIESGADVVLLGVKTVQAGTVEKLQAFKQACPKVAMVLLFASYDVKGIKALRTFSRDSNNGCAYLLKHTVDTADQITQMVHAVAEGRIIIDPMVMEGLIDNGDSQAGFLNELSPREMEVLSWMAKGYRNDTIADVLSRDVKTVERHINNIYSKLRNDKIDESEEMDSLHPRVRATLMYLRATGSLPAEAFVAA